MFDFDFGARQECPCCGSCVSSARPTCKLKVLLRPHGDQPGDRRSAREARAAHRTDGRHRQPRRRPLGEHAPGLDGRPPRIPEGVRREPHLGRQHRCAGLAVQSLFSDPLSANTFLYKSTAIRVTP